MPADNADDPLKTDFTCTFVSNDGAKFQETTDQKVDLQVQASDKTVAFNAQDPAAPSSFKFTVLKSEVANVKIAVKVVNPQNGNKVKGELNKGLPDVIDTTPPNAPNVTGTSTPTANKTPTWTWSSGGGGGNSVYRYKPNNNDLSTGANETRATTWTPSSELSEATHTLYVQERDAAGNWSASGSYAIQVVNPPARPTLSTPTRNVTSLSLSWASVTGATSYNLYWSTSPGVTAGSTRVSNVVSVHTHTSLTGGTTYYYRLAAANNGVEGALSNEVSAAPYTFAAPTVTSISPNSGPLTGGTTVTITGTGFQSGVTVSIGGIPATITNVTADAITATTPSGSSGPVNVTVTNPDAQIAVRIAGFSYTSPSNCTPNPDDCYQGAEGLNVGTIRNGPGGSQMELVLANGGFKVWKEKEPGARILNATGKISNGWQQKLDSTASWNTFAFVGLGNNTGYFTDIQRIAGRVCPPYVYYNGTAKQNTCLYYTDESSSSVDFSSMPSTNGPSTGNSTLLSWFESNFSVCENKGMRLPTAYEVAAVSTYNNNNFPDTRYDFFNPSDASNKVPIYSNIKGIWTATGSKGGIDSYFALIPDGTIPTCDSVNNDDICLADFTKTDPRFGVRCVVPGSVGTVP